MHFSYIYELLFFIIKYKIIKISERYRTFLPIAGTITSLMNCRTMGDTVKDARRYGIAGGGGGGVGKCSSTIKVRYVVLSNSFIYVTCR